MRVKGDAAEMKMLMAVFWAICSIMVLMCAVVLLQPGRDPALTGNEPAAIPASVMEVFAVHGDLLQESADFFWQHPEVFEVTREEWEDASGFFASDADAAAIRRALGEEGVAIVRRLNEEAWLRSIAYYVPTEQRAPALLFNFFPQGYEDGLLICIHTAGALDEPGDAVENVLTLLGENHGALIPLPAAGWYYVESVNALRRE